MNDKEREMQEAAKKMDDDMKTSTKWFKIACAFVLTFILFSEVKSCMFQRWKYEILDKAAQNGQNININHF